MNDPQLQRRAFASALGTLDIENRSRVFVASTEAVDSHGSILRQNWKLDRYKANPIVLYQHESGDPIGTAEVWVDLQAKALMCRIRIAEGTECAERCWTLMKQDVLRAVSVGFRAGKIGSETLEGGRSVEVLDDLDLFEISLVSLPSNPEALARSVPREADPSPIPEGPIMADSSKGEAPVITASADTISRAVHESAIAALQSANAATEARAAELQKTVTEQNARLVALEASNAASRDERLVRKVNDLVGKKIDEAAVPEFLELARSDEAVFDKIVGKLPTKSVLEPVIGSLGGSKPAATDTDAARAMVRKLVDERVAATGEAKHTAMRKVLKAHPELTSGGAS
jgi:HK97 family phage prohead protease